MKSVNQVEVRVTKRGNVLKIVRENYLRTDIPCAHVTCSSCHAPSQYLDGNEVFIISLDTVKTHISLCWNSRKRTGF